MTDEHSSDCSSDSLTEHASGLDKQGNLTKGPWGQPEDYLLVDLVAKYGPRDWSAVSMAMIEQGHHRLGKQCRERYV